MTSLQWPLLEVKRNAVLQKKKTEITETLTCAQYTSSSDKATRSSKIFYYCNSQFRSWEDQTFSISSETYVFRTALCWSFHQLLALTNLYVFKLIICWNVHSKTGFVVHINHTFSLRLRFQLDNWGYRNWGSKTGYYVSS